MVFRLGSLLRNTSISKLTALLLGYLLWFSLTQHTMISRRFKVPLCFYTTHDTLIEQAPEEITVTLRAQRNILMNLDKNLAVHIDASTLKEGPQTVEISEKHLLLPSTLRVQATLPLCITVIAKKI